MRSYFRAKPLASAALLVLFSLSCAKVSIEDEIPQGQKLKKSHCEVAGFAWQYPGRETRYNFIRTYDPAGKTLTQLNAGLYSGGGIHKTLQLNVTYGKNVMHFISAQNAADTGLVVHLNNAGRVIKVEAGYIFDFGFGPQEFFYQNGRLHMINVDNNWIRIWFRYDQWGNVTQIVTDSSDGLARLDHTYQYDHSQKASEQFYQDEARGFSFNVFTTLHAAGLLPELDPVHVRTRATVRWGSYLADDHILANHVFDKGRLLSYQTQSLSHVPTGVTYILNWNCGKKDDQALNTLDLQ